jgi:hypothetical protein
MYNQRERRKGWSLVPSSLEKVADLGQDSKSHVSRRSCLGTSSEWDSTGFGVVLCDETNRLNELLGRGHKQGLVLLSAQGQKDVEDARPDELVVPVFHEEIGKHIKGARKPQEGLMVRRGIEEEGEDETKTTTDKVYMRNTSVAGLHRVHQNSHSVLLDEEGFALVVLGNESVKDVDAGNQSSKASSALKSAEGCFDLDLDFSLVESRSFGLYRSCGSGWLGCRNCHRWSCLDRSSWLCTWCCFARDRPWSLHRR